jgi:hypothetical protein
VNLYRALRALVAIVRHYTRRYEYFAHVRYRVVQQSGDRLHLQALKKGVWPDQTHVSVMPGAGGYECHPQLGSIVLVVFPEGDVELAPVVTHFAGPGQDKFIPISVSIAGADAAVALVGSLVRVAMPPVLPVTGTLSGAPFTGVLTLPGQMLGTVQSGSSKVKAGR